MSKFIIILFLILAIIANIFGYWIKLIVKAKGYKVIYLFVDPWDFFKFVNIIKKEKDYKVKRKYWLIFWTAIISLILFIALFIKNLITDLVINN
ncbi:MAG: hypothetical protein K8R58_13640 [Bacteroidales bacterium]|nr:hypothetical protein [Bacteroidales bacterium]